MKYPEPLKDGVFLKRYKRFFADFTFANSTLTAHVANSGSMKGCSDPNIPCRFIDHRPTERKLPYSLEMVKTASSWVGVNTMRPNQLLWEAWESRAIKHWGVFDRAQKEVKINEASRIDMVLWESKDFGENSASIKNGRLLNHDFSKANPKMHLVEIKNVSLADGDVAIFPDSVTERGQKHLRDLMEAIDRGHTAELVFVIQREDCSKFAPADLIDAKYGKLLRAARDHGVVISPYACKLSAEGIELQPKPVKLDF